MSSVTEGNDKKCQCKVCVLTGRLLAIKEKLTPEEGEAIEQVLNEWAHSSTEAGRADAFLKGHWPGAKPVPDLPIACKHEWNGEGGPPRKWKCLCGTLVYRSYEDYCWD